MGQIITFAQQKGGAGKTTALAHLAAAWSGDGRRVALFDLDPQRSLSRWVELRGDPRLALIESRDYRAGSDMKSAARSHDVVLVDCPGAASSLLENVFRESRLIVAPLQPSVMDIWATQPVLDTARGLGRTVRLLLNRVPPRTRALDEIEAALGPAQPLLLASRLGNRVAFARAMAGGRAAPELARRSPAAEEAVALAEEIDGLLGA